MRMYWVIWIGLLLFTISLSAEVLDVETLSLLRTHQYPLTSYKKVIVLSPPRTGSSLLYNVLHFLFEDSTHLMTPHDFIEPSKVVIKTHVIKNLSRIDDRKALYIVTVRHPVDAAISCYRTNFDASQKIHLYAQNRLSKFYNYFVLFDRLKKMGKEVIILHYEDHLSSVGTLLDTLERLFSFSIAAADREIMERGYSQDNVRQSVQNLHKFSDVLPISGFHGFHISKENYEPPEELIQWLKTYFNRYHFIFESYGYRNFLCEFDSS